MTPPRDTDRPRPDLADMLRRARELDPEQISEGMVHEAGVLDLGEPLRVPEAPDPDVQVFAESARVYLDALAQERSLEPAPPPARRGRRSTLLVGGGLLLTAAAAAAVFLVWRPWSAWTSAMDATSPAQATYVTTPQGESTEALSKAGGKRGSAQRIVLPPEKAPAEVEVDSGAPSAPRPKAPPKRSVAQPSLADRLATTDATAQAHWRAGDLDKSTKLFEEIIALAPHSRQAELAYGDLLSLARQAGSQTREDAVRSRYLEAFPHGRFADDMRAANCRRAPEQRACWDAYLEDFPKGAHRTEATRRRGPEDAP